MQKKIEKGKQAKKIEIKKCLILQILKMQNILDIPETY